MSENTEKKPEAAVENTEVAATETPEAAPAPAKTEESTSTDNNSRQGGGRGRGGNDRRNQKGGKGRRGGKGFEKVKKEFEEELLQVARVTKVTRGGRTLRFRATVALGDKKGRVGLGVGKSGEVVGAIEKAVNRAKRGMITLPIVEGTVPKDVKTKFKSATVMLHPASEGTGIIAGGPTRRILELAGYKNVLAKRYGSTNIINNAYATMQALEQMTASVKKQEALSGK